MEIRGISSATVSHDVIKLIILQGKGKKVKITLEQATKAQWGSRAIALLFH